jgi:hypothetical protein
MSSHRKNWVINSDERGLGGIEASSNELSVRRSSGALDDGLVYQHDRNVVLDRVDPVTSRAFQAFWILSVLKGLLTGRTDQNLQ